MNRLEQLRARREEILALAAKHGAKSVRLFGSVLRGDASEKSDVDLLVNMEPGRSLFDLSGLLVDLEELLGVKVDLVTEGSLHWLLRRRILREARPL